MKKGEIWIVALPGSDGHEQEGLRPVIILADVTKTVGLVVPCTSNLRALALPHVLKVPASKKNGLIVPAIALVLQMRAIDKKRFQKKIGVLEQALLFQIDAEMRALLALNK